MYPSSNPASKRNWSMNNNEHNLSKIVTMNIIADSYEKSFFLFENEFVEWEKQWMWNQVKSRTNIPVNHRDGLKLINMEFLIWLFDRIHIDLTSFGSGCWQVLQIKLKYIKRLNPEIEKAKKKKWMVLKHTLLARFD